MRFLTKRHAKCIRRFSSDTARQSSAVRAASALPGDPDVSRLSHGAPRYGAVTHPATGQLRVGTHDEGLHLASSQGQVGPFFCCAKSHRLRRWTNLISPSIVMRPSAKPVAFIRSSIVAATGRPTLARVARWRRATSRVPARRVPAVAVRRPSKSARPSSQDRSL
jgi:hypothetical protein